ncbi:replication initiation protein, partial [Burkholderia pseudomallei]
EKIRHPLNDAQTPHAHTQENRIRPPRQVTEHRVRSTPHPPVRSAPALCKDARKIGYAPAVETVEARPRGGCGELAA